MRCGEIFCSCAFVVLMLGCVAAEEDSELKLSLTINAKRRLLEVSWINARALPTDMILVTNQEPGMFEKVKVHQNLARGADSAELTASEEEGSGLGVHPLEAGTAWICNNGAVDIVDYVKPLQSRQWFTTSMPFDLELSRNISVHTKCYGYWASYVDGDSGRILATECVRAHPTWMNDMRSIVGNMRLRDLFIPGTHDSGSYRPNFELAKRETIVTKYALTQDDDIYTQLMHGIRYLDIRVGHYKNTHDVFFVNHGITRQRPLMEVINQVKDFVHETNEIVIFGVKEFPVGFGKGLDVHRKLVNYLRQHFGELLVDPSQSWQVVLRDVWQRKQNIFLAYDKMAIVAENPTTLYGPVDQRWGNVRTWAKLENHLRLVNSFDTMRLSSRPVADMAELTPDTWGVLTDKYGGLRKMADEVNWRISDLYRDEFGENANIVAVDFYRGTNLVDLAIYWNKKKVIY